MLFEYKNVGKEIYDLAVKLYPINRSIMGEGNRETLRIIRDIIPEMEIKEIPSGTEVFEYQYTATGVKYTAPSGFHDDASFDNFSFRSNA